MSGRSTPKNVEELRKRVIEEIQYYAIMTLDLDGTILTWNKVAEKIKGFSNKEIIGQNFNIFYMPSDRQKHLPEKFLQTALDDGYALYSGSRVRKDGSTFYGIMLLTTLYNERNKATGFAKLTRALMPEE